MRIRGSSSMNSPSSSANCSSISTFSVLPSASSTNSLASFSSNCSSSIGYESRCEGLDLLVKAVLHVAGSLLVVPFTQRRVIRRRKKAFRFCNSFATEFGKKEEQEQEREKEEQEKGERIEVISKPKRRKRVMALPTKYQDSVLQPWIRRTRRRQSIEINDESS